MHSLGTVLSFIRNCFIFLFHPVLYQGIGCLYLGLTERVSLSPAGVMLWYFLENGFSFLHFTTITLQRWQWPLVKFDLIRVSCGHKCAPKLSGIRISSMESLDSTSITCQSLRIVRIWRAGRDHAGIRGLNAIAPFSLSSLSLRTVTNTWGLEKRSDYMLSAYFTSIISKVYCIFSYSNCTQQWNKAHTKLIMRGMGIV